MSETRGGSGAGFLPALGAEIRYWRERRGLTRPELAAMVGVSFTTLGRIERVGPSDLPATWRIADALGVSMSVLVQRAEEAARIADGLPATERSIEAPPADEAI